mgnify:CR=1 FL=1
MYSLSQQDTSRDNRLNMLVESRVRREVQARFGGEFLETYRRNTARHRVLSLRLTAQYLVLFVAGLLGVFVCFAPYDDPEIAVAIVIEKGGSGAALAWPLLESACRVLREMASFASAGVSQAD